MAVNEPAYHALRDIRCKFVRPNVFVAFVKPVTTFHFIFNVYVVHPLLEHVFVCGIPETGSYVSSLSFPVNIALYESSFFPHMNMWREKKRQCLWKTGDW